MYFICCSMVDFIGLWFKDRVYDAWEVISSIISEFTTRKPYLKKTNLLVIKFSTRTETTTFLFQWSIYNWFSLHRQSNNIKVKNRAITIAFRQLRINQQLKIIEKNKQLFLILSVLCCKIVKQCFEKKFVWKKYSFLHILNLTSHDWWCYQPLKIFLIIE